MSKQNNRRGFTITELVIVIVVIAILAAVLIPTFASLINKANQSADIQAARQMNMALQSASAVEEPETFEEVIDILAEAGYDAENSLKPITADHQFYWYSTYNVIILVNEEDAENPVVVYPTDDKDVVDTFAGVYGKTGAEQVLFDLEAGFRQFVTVEVESAEDVVTALSKGQSVTLTEDVELKQPISIPAGANTTIDLNGKTMTTDLSDATKHHYAINNSGNVIIEDGTFNARGIQNYAGATMTIKEDAVINALDANGGACIWNYAGAEVIIEGGVFTATSGDKATDEAGIVPEPGVINNSGKVTINGGTFAAPNTGCYAINNTGEMIINGGDFSAYRGMIACTDGTVTVNNGKFAVTHNAGGWAAYTAGSGKIIINGGQFTSQGGMFTGDGIQDKR